jgi:hypothetical protein
MTNLNEKNSQLIHRLLFVIIFFNCLYIIAHILDTFIFIFCGLFLTKKIISSNFIVKIIKVL